MKAAAALLLLAAAAAGQTRQAANLLPNGGFERGGGGDPRHWDRPDGLTSFWVKDPRRRGRCMRFDTDVYKEEYYRRREQMKQPDPPPAKKKTPTRGKKYGTAAGVTGVPFFSGFVPIDPGHPYRLTLEFMPGRAGLPGAKLVPKVFVKGYIKLVRRDIWDEKRQQAVTRAVDRVAFKEYLNLEGGERDRWKSWSFCFWPGRRNPMVKRLKVMLFPYWPPGEYYFDNLRLEAISRAEWEKHNRLLREVERREKARKGRVFPGRGAGNTPSRRQREEREKKRKKGKEEGKETGGGGKGT